MVTYAEKFYPGRFLTTFGMTGHCGGIRGSNGGEAAVTTPHIYTERHSERSEESAGICKI